MKEKLSKKKFDNVLMKVHLAGLIETCVMEIKKGICTVEAVDATNTIFLHVEENLKQKKLTAELGLGDISILRSFIQLIDDEEIKVSIDKNRLVIKRGKRGKLNYLLSEPETITTTADTPGAIKKLVKQFETEMAITDKIRDDFTQYIKILKTTDASLTVKKGAVSFIVGTENEHQVSVPVGKIKSKDSFSVKLYGDYVANVLNVIDFGKEPVMMIGDELPVVFKQDEKNIFAIAPIAED